MPNQPATKNRVVRIPDELWDGAKAATARAGETVTAVVTRALTDYVANPPPKGSRCVGDLICPRCQTAVGRRGGAGNFVARHMNPEGEWCQ